MQNLRDAADAAKSRISALEEGKRMGLNPDRAGFCCCPFHQEKTASMKLYTGERGYHCFGCGATGDVINLVMAYYGLSFRQALVRLDTEWGLGLILSARPLSHAEQRRQEFERWLRELNLDTAERWQETAIEAYYTACRLFDGFMRQAKENPPTGPDSGWNAAFCAALRNLAEARETADDLAIMAIGGG